MLFELKEENKKTKINKDGEEIVTIERKYIDVADTEISYTIIAKGSVDAMLGTKNDRLEVSIEGVEE